jgi:hypothetical protein
MTKKIAIITIFAFVANSAVAQQPPEPTVTVTIPITQYQKILELIKHQPWDEINPLMLTLVPPLSAKMQELQAPPKGLKNE